MIMNEVPHLQMREPAAIIKTTRTIVYINILVGCPIITSEYFWRIHKISDTTHGVATKYLNRYNALFSKVYRTTKAVVDDIYELLCDRDDRNSTILESQTRNLLQI